MTEKTAKRQIRETFGEAVTNEIIEALTNKWIPCSEKLPACDLPVYITYKSERKNYFCPIPCVLSKNGHWYNHRESVSGWANLDEFDDWLDDEISGEVVAWMPMFEPYKGVKNKQ